LIIKYLRIAFFKVRMRLRIYSPKLISVCYRFLRLRRQLFGGCCRPRDSSPFEFENRMSVRLQIAFMASCRKLGVLVESRSMGK
jgi:hypothetical protein